MRTLFFIDSFKPILLVVCLSACQATVTGIGGDDAPIVPPPPSPTDVPFDATARMGDRLFVASALTNVFVPSSVASNDSNRMSIEASIRTHVSTQYVDFGNACDQLLVDRAETDPCFVNGLLNESSTKIAFFVPTTSIRSALSLRAIYAILAPGTPANMAMQNVISRCRGVAYASINLSTVTAPARFEIENLFALVYPGSTPSADSVDKLLALGAATSTPVEAWRFTIIAVLSSLLWQIP